ncbi:kp78a-related [Anaeramoeba flamelloides]|uniref:Kp78a-related n=1 Tax=Anaeramoeba flamelloides TaxID=1746091 RepID=A0ABQ8YVB8_9EUKA|nr:kp78a-related [Anaeramoeba flamelloides]
MISSNWSTVCGDYIFGKIVGVGSYGKVRVAKHLPTNELVAIKTLEKSKFTLDRKAKNQLFREIQILKKLNHKNIVKLIDMFENEKYWFIVTEYINGGDLSSMLEKKKRLKESDIKKLFVQLVKGIEYCHSKNIIHRDLKLENLLITDEKKLKIIDFGLSNFSEKGELLKTHCGSPSYTAPEIFSEQKYDGFKSDIWSLGVLLYALLVGKLPFISKNPKFLYEKIITGSFLIPNFLSKEAQNLLSKLIVVDPHQRLSIGQILEHNWLRFESKKKKIKDKILYNQQINNINSGLIDPLIVLQMTNLGHNISKVLNDLENNDDSELRPTYFIYNEMSKKGNFKIQNQEKNDLYNKNKTINNNTNENIFQINNFNKTKLVNTLKTTSQSQSSTSTSTSSLSLSSTSLISLQFKSQSSSTFSSSSSSPSSSSFTLQIGKNSKKNNSNKNFKILNKISTNSIEKKKEFYKQIVEDGLLINQNKPNETISINFNEKNKNDFNQKKRILSNEGIIKSDPITRKKKKKLINQKFRNLFKKNKKKKNKNKNIKTNQDSEINNIGSLITEPRMNANTNKLLLNKKENETLNIQYENSESELADNENILHFNVESSQKNLKFIQNENYTGNTTMNEKEFTMKKKNYNDKVFDECVKKVKYESEIQDQKNTELEEAIKNDDDNGGCSDGSSGGCSGGNSGGNSGGSSSGGISGGSGGGRCSGSSIGGSGSNDEEKEIKKIKQKSNKTIFIRIPKKSTISSNLYKKNISKTPEIINCHSIYNQFYDKKNNHNSSKQNQSYESKLNEPTIGSLSSKLTTKQGYSADNSMQGYSDNQLKITTNNSRRGGSNRVSSVKKRASTLNHITVSNSLLKSRNNSYFFDEEFFKKNNANTYTNDNNTETNTETYTDPESLMNEHKGPINPKLIFHKSPRFLLNSCKKILKSLHFPCKKINKYLLNVSLEKNKSKRCDIQIEIVKISNLKKVNMYKIKNISISKEKFEFISTIIMNKLNEKINK